MSMEIPGIGKQSPLPDFPTTTGGNQAPRRLPGDQPSATVAGRRRQAEYEKLIEKLINTVAPYDRELKYTINHKLGEVVVKVIDTRTDKVIKEIPPADIQRLQEKIREAVGLLIDEKI